MNAQSVNAHDASRRSWGYIVNLCLRSGCAVTVLIGASACSGGANRTATISMPSPAPTPMPTPTPTPTPASAPPSVERLIAPAAVNPALSSADPDYVVINPDPSVAARQRLFVMLPGTGGAPRELRELMRFGPPRGYHVIGLTYPNDTTVGERCAGNSDINCTGNTRREIITGVDTSPVIAVDPAHSIVGRLTQLLMWLDRTYPAEGWSRFMANGSVDWSLVTIGGHSQGSGHAAYMATVIS